MDAFEASLNEVLMDAFNNILKYEETSLKTSLQTSVTITEAHMIEAIGKRENKETNASELAACLGIAAPTVTVAVRKLESKGFIKKVPCETDARRTIIRLTDEGRKVEKIHHLFHERMVRNISSQFRGAEKEVLLKAVTTLGEFFKTKVETRT